MFFNCPVCGEKSYMKQTIGYRNKNNKPDGPINLYEYMWVCINEECNHRSNPIPIKIKNISDINKKRLDCSSPL